MKAQTPRPIDVGGLFRPDRDALVDLLTGLSPAEWSTPTVCSGWDVHDVALHVLGGDLGNIARRRDGFRWEPPSGERLGEFLDRINQEWVRAARRLSTRLTIDLLRFTGPMLFEYFDGLDPSAMGGRVSWAGPKPAPIWLDLAREYMERWVHQQHVRDAVGRPGQRGSRSSAPVIAASMHALPLALASRDPGPGTAVTIRITGDAGGQWSLLKGARDWRLLEGCAQDATATVVVPSDDWWRIVTLGLTSDQALGRVRVEGDPALAKAVLSAVAIIA